MTSIELIPIREQLDRIEKKLDGKYTNRYLGINQVSTLVNLSNSTIYRATKRKSLKCSRKLGKLLFLESDVRKWLDG